LLVFEGTYVRLLLHRPRDATRNFIDLLTPAELDMLAALNERVLHHLATDDDSPAEDEPV